MHSPSSGQMVMDSAVGPPADEGQVGLEPPGVSVLTCQRALPGFPK